MIKKLFNKKINNDKKGFALLFSVLVSVMVLAVGASIINIALKQVILSGAGRESQFAFYAANTGLECALYWDLRGAGEGGGGFEYVFPPAGQPTARTNSTGDLYCAGTNIAIGSSAYSQDYTKVWDDTVDDVTVFRLAISNSAAGSENVLYCAEVVVEKYFSDKNSDGEDEMYTTITSRGMNTCEPDTDNRAVERGIVLEYRS